MELVKVNNGVIEFNAEQVELIKKQIAPKATDQELKLFLYQCKRTGLDPLTRQIYCIHRKEGQSEKMTVQTSIDGFRVIAERSGVYAGQGEPEFTENADGSLLCCKVRVYKFGPNGQRYEAAVGVAYWEEYVQVKDEWVNGQKTGKKTPAAMWGKMPRTMLAKVAEAIALRKSFPQDLSGLYTGDEMEQSDIPVIVEDTTAVVIEAIEESDRQLLIELLNGSTLEEGTVERSNAYKSIMNCKDYKTYEKIHHRLESLQKEPVNKQPRDINKDLRRVQSEA
jgi:phage recombination protein Bet